MGTHLPRTLIILISLGLTLTLAACDRDSEEAAPATDEVTDEVADEGAEEPIEVSAPEINLDDLPFVASGPVATVDGEEITADEFNQAVYEQVSRMPGQIPAQMMTSFMHRTLDFLIDKKIIDDVLEAENIEVTDEELDQAYEEFRQRFPDDQTFTMYLAQLGMTPEGARDSMRPDVALERYLRARYELEVTEEQARAHFEENRESFGEPDTAHVWQILARVPRDGAGEEEARQKVQAAYEALQAGRSFGEVATEFSEGPTANRGGELGPVPRGALPPQLDEVAFSIELNEISEPIHSPFGFHVLRVTERSEGTAPAFEEVRSRVEAELRHEQNAEAFQRFLDEKKAEVEVVKLVENVEMRSAPIPPAPDMPNLQLNMPGSTGGAGAAPGQRPGQGEGQGGRQLQLDPSLLPQQ